MTRSTEGDSASESGSPAASRLASLVEGRGEALALGIGFLALAAAVVGTRWGVFAPDTRPDLYEQPGKFLASTFDAWVGGAMGLGQGNFNAGAAPVAAVVWVIRTLGAPAWLAVRIWRLILLVVAVWGIRRYMRELFGDALSPLSLFAVSVFWVANPYVIVAGNTTPILLPYALLAPMMLAFLRAARNGGWRWPAVFALVFFAQGGLNAGVVTFFGLLALPAHVVFVRVVDGRSWRDLLGAVSRSGVLSVLVSLYWLAPSFLASGTGAAIASSTEQPRDVARTSSYSEVGRGLGQWALYGREGDRYFLGGYTVYLSNPVVVAATMLVTVAVGAALWRSRRPARIMAIGLLVVGLPVSVGMFPGVDPHPAGRVLEGVFERVPATMAFRTTNKVGAVIILGSAISVALGVEALRRRTATRTRSIKLAAGGGVAAILLGISTPMWNGSLYPLGKNVPDTWLDATADLDAAGDGRVLVVPGGTGGNYRWGMRSPDDLFPSHLDRPVVSRNTVVGAGDPTGNLLTWFDTSLQQGTLAADGVSTMARYLGADTVLDRNDVLSEETNGAAPSTIAEIVRGDSGLVPVATYGEPGVDTIPGTNGVPTAEQRAMSPADAELPAIEVHEVEDPIGPIVAAPADRLVVIDGDGLAFSSLTDVGIIDGTQPFRYLGDLDADGLLTALRDGARLTLTDTNQRRGWDINRLLDASTPVLGADDPFTLGNGPSITLWPDDPDRQTVAEMGATSSPAAVSVSAVEEDVDRFGVSPWAKPLFAADGNIATAWWAGGILDPTGATLTIDLAEPIPIERLLVQVPASGPAIITELRVEVGDQAHTIEPKADEGVGVPIEAVTADRIRLTITGVSAGLNPVGISEVTINDGEAIAVDVLRLPLTLDRLADEGGADLATALTEAPVDIVLSRLRGRSSGFGDDEEHSLNRRFELPIERTFTFTAQLDRLEVGPELIEAFEAGSGSCTTVAMLDGVPLAGRITDTDGESAAGSVTVEGCEPVELGAGSHEITSFFGWRLNQIHLASPGANAPAEPVAPTPVEVIEVTATRLVMDVPPGDGERFLRLGIAHDPRWKLSFDGVDAGEPIVLDGYSLGWRIGADGGRAIVEFPPQSAVRVGVVVSAVGLVAVTAIAVAPGIAWPGARRDDDVEAASEAGSDPDGRGGDL